MEPKRLQRLLTIVDKALSMESTKRTHYVNKVCGEDTILREEVDRLLKSVGASENFWDNWKEWNEQQISEIFQSYEEQDETGEQLIGPWRLIRQIGRGGMGTVWLAERFDGAFEKQVARYRRNFGIRCQPGPG